MHSYDFICMLGTGGVQIESKPRRKIREDVASYHDAMLTFSQKLNSKFSPDKLQDVTGQPFSGVSLVSF